MAFLRKRNKYFWIIVSPREKRFGFYSHSLKTANKKLADMLCREYNNEIKRTDYRSHQTTLPATSLKLDDAFRLYCQHRKNTKEKYNDKTIQNYQLAINKIKNSCGDKSIGEYDEDDYHSFINSMEEVSHNTRAINSRCIYSLFNWAVKQGYMDRHYFKKIPEKQSELTIKTKEEITALIKFAKDTKYYYQVKFQLIAAARLMETLTFKKKYIKEDELIFESKGQGKKFRRIPILNDMRNLLNEMQLPHKPDGLLFPFGEWDIWRFYKTFKEKTGIDMHSHQLRSYTLSKFANEEKPIIFVKDYAGHSTIKTTEKYYLGINRKKLKDSLNGVNFDELDKISA